MPYGKPRARKGISKVLFGGAVLLLGGCVWVGTGPQLSWQTRSAPSSNTSAVNVGLELDGHPLGQTAGQYRTQYVESDVQDIVVGLFNEDTGTEWGQLGEEYTGSGLTLSTISFGALSGNCVASDTSGTSPAYLATMAGCGSIGLIGATASLPLAQYRNGSRWLVVHKGAALNWTTKTTQFGNLYPDANYVLFAEAFLKTLGDSTAATESDVAGVATMSVDAPAGQTTSATLNLTLNYNEATVSATVNASTATPSATAI